MCLELLLFITVTLTAYTFQKWATTKNDYFKKRGVKSTKPTFLLGNTGQFLFKKQNAAEVAQKLYNDFPEEPVYGLFDFLSPTFILRDVEAIKKITVKDFDHFDEHKSIVNEAKDRLLGNSLIFLKGIKWRDMRSTLSPAFTGSKMRQMFDLVCECAEDYAMHFLKWAEDGKRINIEAKDSFTRYMNDVVASCAFGIRVNSVANPRNEFFENSKRLIDFRGILQIIKVIIFVQLPRLAEILGLQVLDKKASKRFRSIILDAMETRKKNNIFRPDMINTMMQVREGSLKSQTEEKLNESDAFATIEESDVGKRTVTRTWTEDDIAAQCFSFLFGGLDTLSSMLTFAAYELVVNPNVQRKLYEEIAETDERIGCKRITYDELQKLKYLDQVVCETLRKWPSSIRLERQCVKKYNFDDGKRCKFTIEKGVQVLIPVYGLHHSPKYFPNPERFDPERFNEENKKNIIQGTFIPFGIGPRACIGSRFALMTVKAIFYYLLLNFSFEANEKTDIPIKLHKNPSNLRSENGVNIELKPRNK